MNSATDDDAALDASVVAVGDWIAADGVPLDPIPIPAVVLVSAVAAVPVVDGFPILLFISLLLVFPQVLGSIVGVLWCSNTLVLLLVLLLLYCFSRPEIHAVDRISVVAAIYNAVDVPTYKNVLI
jgi:hypothetical protein